LPRQIRAEYRRFGKALTQHRQIVARATARIEHVRGCHLDVIEPFAHALRDFARQERNLAEGRGTAIENAPQASRIIGRTASLARRGGHGSRTDEECEVYSLASIRSAQTPCWRLHRHFAIYRSTHPPMQLSPLLRQSSALIRRTLHGAKRIEGARPFLSRLL